MTKKEAIKKLNELKAMNLPKMSYEDIKQTIERRGLELSNEQIKICDEYMNRFAKLDDPHKCLWCGSSRYEWGILHGSAYCAKCGWEYRVYHYIKDENGNDILSRIEAVLQYHPDGFSVNE
jgi:predicted Zn-ribbon and HTH transcriptional regulator